jgi:hypothetical protein
MGKYTGLELIDNYDGSLSYLRKEYFKDNKMIYSVVLKNTLKKKKHIRKIKTVLLNDGIFFLKDNNL